MWLANRLFPSVRRLQARLAAAEASATIYHEPTERLNAHVFDEQAATYDNEFNLSPELSRSVALRIKELLPPQVIRTVIELGCGTGNLTAALALEGVGNSYIGLDISPGMLKTASAKLTPDSPCAFVNGSAVLLPFPDSTADLCVCSALLHHMVYPLPCLVEIYRVLRPGGCAWLTEPTAPGYRFLEFLLSEFGDPADEGLKTYLSYLSYMRENANDPDALASYIGVDKHIFPTATLQSLIRKAGFSQIMLYPSCNYYPGILRAMIEPVLMAITVSLSNRTKIISAVERLDRLAGSELFDRLSLHTQIVLQK